MADWLTGQSTPGLYVLDDATIEMEFEWVFFYTSGHSVAGNAPVIVDRRDGVMHATGRVPPVEYYIDQYRRKRAPGRAQ
jgi:hypothetical protein